MTTGQPDDRVSHDSVTDPQPPASTDPAQVETAMTPPPTSPTSPSPWETEPPGAHQQERPVPRPTAEETVALPEPSQPQVPPADTPLSETNSAALLTGESPATYSEAPPATEAQAYGAPATQPLASPYDTAEQPVTPQSSGPHYEVPAAGYGAPAPTTAYPTTPPHGGYSPEPTPGPQSPGSPYEPVEPPRSRGLAHTISLLATIVLAPITMLALAAVHSRLAAEYGVLVVEGGRYSLGLLAATVGALLLVVALGVLARWSSLGAFVMGAVTFLFGLAALLAPAVQTMGWLISVRDWLNGIGDLALGTSLVQLIGSGQLAVMGLALLLAGYISRSARRAGRRYERAVAHHGP